MLVLDDIDHLINAASQLTPSVPLFVKCLAELISDFNYPLVATMTDARVVNAHPELVAAFDGQIALTPWQAVTVQSYVDKFATNNEIPPTVIAGAISTTPKELISALRQCRLQNDMTPIQDSLQVKSSSDIGFLAKVS